MKKKLMMLFVGVLTVGVLTACGSDSKAGESKGSTISVVSREDGSGTRGAFIELFGIEKKGADGKKEDLTTTEASIANKTDVMLTNIAQDPDAIGYVSLGSLNDTVKAVKINGVASTVDNIKNKSYEIARPFNLATKEELSEVATDFMNYILSTEGQKVVEENGYIQVGGDSKAFESNKAAGKIVVSGSSSVTPVMEKLKEAYLTINPSAEIEVQMSDSTTGMQSAMDGTCDIGMASRDLKDSEKAALKHKPIALDGIAIIVNKENKVEDLTKDQVKAIYTGEATTWDFK